MTKDVYVVETDPSATGRDRTLSVEALSSLLKTHRARDAIMFLPDTESAAKVLREVARFLPALLAKKRGERQEKRIEGMLDYMLDFDPLDAAEARIDVMNAEMRRDFLRAFQVLDAAAIHRRAGHEGSNTAQTAAAWRRAERILGLPLAGKTVYPVFQFDADGQPYPLVREVLQALPADRSAWQRAFWLVAPNEWLDGARPFEAIQMGDPAVLDAARHAGEVPVG